MAEYKSGRATGALTPADIPRPGVARDPGVTARPATVFLGEPQDTRGKAMGTLAAGMQSFSNDMAAIGQTFARLANQRQDAEDAVGVDHRQLLLNQRIAPIVQERLSSPDASRPDFITKLDEQLAKEQVAVDDEMKQKGHVLSTRGQQHYEHAAMQLRIGAARGAAVAANNQRVSLLTMRTEENVNNIAQMAGGSGDIDAAFKRVDSSIETMRPVLAPDKLKHFSERAKSLVLETAVDGHIRRGEVDKAQALVDRFTGFVKPEASEADKAVTDAAKQRGVDPAVALAIVNIESGGDPNKKNPKSSASGLFQMITDTARRYGLPSDGTPVTIADEARAGAALTADNIAALRRGLGGEPNPTDVYLAHFLGAPTAVRALRGDPGVKVTDLLSPQAIAANPGIAHNGKKLADMTVGDLYSWAQGRMGEGLKAANGVLGGRTVGAGDAAVPIKDAMQLGHKVHNAATAERARLRVVMNDDVESIKTTGQPLPIDQRAAAAIMPQGDMVIWKERREDARAYFDTVADMGQQNEAEIVRRTNALAPVAGEVGFARRQKVYREVVGIANKHLETRRTDPAQAVADDPAVQQALSQYDPEKPSETWKPVVDARLAAQDRIGIPEDRRSPITQREAKVFAEPLANMLPGQERAVLTEVATAVQQQFGPHADKAFVDVLRANRVRGETAVTAARIAKKLGLGQPVTEQDSRALNNAGELDAADAATGAASNAVPHQGQPFAQPGGIHGGSISDTGEAPVATDEPPGEPGKPVPPREDIEALRANPERAKRFDEKWGKGSAKEILDKYKAAPKRSQMNPLELALPNPLAINPLEVVNWVARKIGGDRLVNTLSPLERRGRRKFTEVYAEYAGKVRDDPNLAGDLDRRYGAGTAQMLIEYDDELKALHDGMGEPPGGKGKK